MKLFCPKVSVGNMWGSCWVCHGFVVGTLRLRYHEIVVSKGFCWEYVGLMLGLPWLCGGDASTEVS